MKIYLLCALIWAVCFTSMIDPKQDHKLDDVNKAFIAAIIWPLMLLADE